MSSTLMSREKVSDKASLRKPSRLVNLVPPLVVLVVGVTLWELLTRTGAMSTFWVSSPTLLVERAAQTFQTAGFYNDVYITMQEVLLGLAGGVLLGMATGMAFYKWRLVYTALDPYVMMLYSTPRIALAPLFILWLGIGLMSKVLLAMIVAYAVMVYSTYAAFANVDDELVSSVRTMGASDWFVTKRVRLPSSVPWLFSGIRLSLGSALPGAIVAEMLGSTAGIGHELARAKGSFDVTGMVVYLLVLGGIALAINGAMKRGEQRLMRWRVGPGQQGPRAGAVV